MAYLDPKPMTPARIWSIGIVVLIHAALLYALINGGYSVAKKTLEEMKMIDIQEAPPPPPPPDKPPPPPPKDLPPPPVFTPPPIVRTPPISQPPITTTVTPPPVYTPPPVAPARPSPPPPPPAPPPAPPPVQTSKLTPKGNPAGWATNDDYPPAAMRNEEQGTTGFALQVGPDGRVTSCSVTSSSGSSTLDDTTCRLVTRRAKFTPGKDASGNPIGGAFSSRIRWQIPRN